MMLRLNENIAKALEDDKILFMLSIDQSQFFNLCSIPELLVRLKEWFGINDEALNALRSYVEMRKMRCKVKDCESSYVDIPNLAQGNNLVGRIATFSFPY